MGIQTVIPKIIKKASFYIDDKSYPITKVNHARARTDFTLVVEGKFKGVPRAQLMVKTEDGIILSRADVLTDLPAMAKDSQLHITLTRYHHDSNW